MRIIDAATVRAATPWPELIDAIGEVLVKDAARSPGRHVHPVALPGGGEGSLLLMPAWMDCEMIGVKAVTYFPSNAGTAVPTVNATYLVFDGRTGQALAVLDGDELTARRTAAVSALAADRLARDDAARLLVVGTGVLSPNMARAHASVRPLTEIEVWGRRTEAAAAVAETLRAEGLPARPVSDLDERIGQADIVAGASLSGDLAEPLAAGVITEASMVADLRALINGDHPGRTSPEEITLFKSAGFAAADLAAARLALR